MRRHPRPPAVPATPPVPAPADATGADVFLAEVTDAAGAGAAAVYGFVEVHVEGGAGGVVERASGRRAEADLNPARYPGGGTLEVGDLVLARRNVGAVNEYEILSAVGRAGSSSGSVSFVDHRNPRCEDGILTFDEVTVTLHGNVWVEES